MLFKRNNVSLILSGALALSIFSVSLNADSLITSDGYPAVYYDDTDYTGSSAADYQWYTHTYVTSDASTSRWELLDSLTGSTPIEIYSQGEDYRLIVHTNSAVGLANDMLYVTDDGKVGIGGITSPSDDLHIGGTGDIVLDDGNLWSIDNWGYSSPGSMGFAIRDRTNNTNPFIIENNATSNTLYLAVDNLIGIGTNDPQENIHIVDTEVSGDITTGYSASALMRMDTVDDSNWTIGAHRWKSPILNTFPDCYFSINDTTNNTTPFRISLGTPTGTMKIAYRYIRMGDSTNPVKVYFSDTITNSWSGSNTERDGTKYLVSFDANNTESDLTSDAGFAMENKREGFTWEFRTYEATQGFTATKAGTGGGEFIIENTTTDYHNAKMVLGGVTVFENGHLVTASSRELKTDIKPLDTEAALDAFHKLQPVSYEYKTQRGEKVVGFIAEDVPELVAMPSRKTFDSAEVVAVLTKVVQEQDKRLAEKEAEIEAMKQDIAELKEMKKKVAMMESILTQSCT